MWRKLRQAKLMLNPLCEICQNKGVVTPAIEVHHRDSFMNYDGAKRLELAFNPDNLMSVCKSCHQELHNKQKK